jgi:hypothetical protein
MAYSTPKSPGRDSVAQQTNAKADLQNDAKKSSGKASNQEQFTNRGTRPVQPTTGGKGMRYMDTDRQIGSRVQFAKNEKGTSDLKNPLNSYRAKIYPAVQNPDPVKDRSGVNKAPGRRAPNTGPAV